MRHTWLIAKKDLRQFWLEIALVVACAAVVAWLSARPWQTFGGAMPADAFGAQPLVEPPQDDLGGITAFESTDTSTTSTFSLLWPIAWCLLIARLVHADGLVGDRHFWLTRPYGRRSLFAAKLLSVITFVNMPIFIAQAWVVHADGFAIGHQLSALVWEQVLITGLIVLPSMALASITSTLPQYVFLALGALIGGTVARALLGSTNLLMMAATYLSVPAPASAGPMGWIADLAGLAAALALCAAVLHIQFLHRRTARARGVAIAGAAAALALWTLMPWPLLFAAEQALGEGSASSLRIELPRPHAADPVRLGTTGTLDLPLRLEGLDAGTLFICEAASIVVDDGAGPIWRSGSLRLDARVQAAPGDCRVRPFMNQPFESHVDTRVHVRASVYVTIFGHERSVAIVPGAPPIEVRGVGLCRALPALDRGAVVNCRAAFRWPPGLLWVRAADGAGHVFTRDRSYSPLPAELQIDPLLEYYASGSVNEHGAAVIVSQSPTAYVRLQTALSDVRLGDLEYMPGSHVASGR